MEFKQAKMQEWPNEGLIARFEHEIAPLLRNRRIFAESANFALYDLWAQDGGVDENVFAYSNNFHGERSLIAYNNAYPSTRGTLHHSAAFMDKGSGEMRQRSIAEGLGLPYDGGLFVAYRDVTSNLEYLRRATDIHHNGVTLDLRGFQYVVLLQWRELRASAEKPWDRLHDMLNGSGVYSLEEALSRLRLRPVHEALRQTFRNGRLQHFAENPGTCADHLEAPATLFFSQVQAYLTEEGTPLEVPLKVPGLPVVQALPESFTAPASVLIEEPELSPGKLSTLLSAPSSPVNGTRLLELDALPPGVAVPLDSVPAHSKASLNPTIPAAFSDSPEEPDTEEAGTEDRLAPANIHVHQPTLEEHFIGNLRAQLAEIAIQRRPASALRNDARAIPGLAQVSAVQAQAPALAVALIRALPADESTDPKAHAALFDRLLLRAGLAESFASLGLEGEGAWRAAALTRILLAHNIGSVNTEAFWHDPDVRWLVGVHENEEISYFRRELFAELLPWLEFDPETHALTEGEPATDEALLARAEAAEYQVRRFLHPAGFVEASHGFVTLEALSH